MRAMVISTQKESSGKVRYIFLQDVISLLREGICLRYKASSPFLPSHPNFLKGCSCLSRNASQQGPDFQSHPQNQKSMAPAGASLPKRVRTSFILFLYVLCPLSSPVLAGPYRPLALLKHLLNTDSTAESISSPKTYC